jgi:kynureninase
MAIHRASLEIFDEVGMENLRKKSELLTGYLEFIIEQYNEANPERALNIVAHQKIKMKEVASFRWWRFRMEGKFLRSFPRQG